MVKGNNSQSVGSYQVPLAPDLGRSLNGADTSLCVLGNLIAVDVLVWFLEHGRGIGGPLNVAAGLGRRLSGLGSLLLICSSGHGRLKELPVVSS